jgi:hypothetical protein
MGLFSQKKLKPKWIFKAPENLKFWKVFPSRGDKILCELRDTDKKFVKFVCVSMDDGVKVWEDLNLDEPWWVQISDTDEDLFFLCEFRRPDFPVQGKIYAVDSGNGKILWENDDYNFLFALDGKVYASKNLIDKRIYFEIDSRTGEVIREYGENIEFINSAKDIKFESMNFIETSEPFDELHSNYEEINEIVKPFIEDATDKFTPEILVKQNFSIVSYHAQKGDKFASILKIIDIEKGELVYQDLLYDNLSYFVPDSFFVKDDFVFYVRNQKELVAIKLPIGL